MKNNAVKTTLLAGTMFLAVLAGCAADESTAPIGSAGSGGSGGSTTIEGEVTYKPFASEHADKFSLGDFDSPYLLQVEGYNFATAGSTILLNNITHEVTKTDYQSNTYLGIAGFSFSDYTDFISTNAALTIKVNLVEANGSVIVSGAVVSGLLVTKATNLYTWQDLQGMKHNPAGGYQLMNDITFPDRGSQGLPMEGFDPVGTLTGSFDGNNHTITNLSIERPTRSNVGMWVSVNNANSVIKDFVLDHAGIRGSRYVGAVAGELNSGMISNVGVVSSRNMSVSGDSGSIGGLVGDNIGTVIGYATVDVSGSNTVGGLVGWNQNTVIGYSTGDVSGNDNVGGLVGYSEGNAVIGYATGRVSGGGLVGWNDIGTANGYWDIGSSMRDTSSGGNTVVGISSITNVVFTSPDTYTDNKGTATDATDDVVVFNNATFLMHFVLPGASETWPTLNAQSSSPQP